MDSESIAHSGSTNNCFSKFQLVGQKYREKTTLGRWWAITYSLVVAQPIRTQH